MTDVDAALDTHAEIPAYLLEAYWWAYVHPRAVRLFERQWLVNLILWGHFDRLRDQTLRAMAGAPDGITLQVACVYGDLTPRLALTLGSRGKLHVLDVLPIQLHNLSRKLPAGAAVTLMHADSCRVPAPDASYDRVLLFFLMHEQPEAVRRATLSEAVRVLKPGGKMVIVDYHRPGPMHPLRLLMRPLLNRLEPYALDLWRDEISVWMPATTPLSIDKRLFCGGLYQLLECVK